MCLFIFDYVLDIVFEKLFVEIVYSIGCCIFPPTRFSIDFFGYLGALANYWNCLNLILGLEFFGLSRRVEVRVQSV